MQYEKRRAPMSQSTNHFDPNNPERQEIDHLEAPLSDRRQKLMLNRLGSDSTERNLTPPELYGCLCHKPDRDATFNTKEVTEHGSVESL